MTTATDTLGYAPAVLIGKPDGSMESNAPENKEQEKYQKLWGNGGGYRDFAPGEQWAQVFLAQANPKVGENVIDFGCGTGRGALGLAVFGRMKVTMVDFTDNCLDEDIKNMLVTQADVMSFVQADLEKPLPVAAKYGFCTDVMEHIPPEKVDVVIDNILKAAQHVFFAISTVPDHFGQTIGEQLHLTVESYEWWLEKFRKHDAVIHWSSAWDQGAFFYVSAWTTGADLVKTGRLNTEEEEILGNIKVNITKDLKLCVPHNKQEIPVMILAGGPSLNKHWDEIIEKRKSGQPLVTVNGTYNQAIERGLEPSAQIIVDARDFNKRFVVPHVAKTKYLFASQVHPDTIEAAPKDQVYLWHAAASSNDVVGKILDEYYKTKSMGWFPVPGGSTAVLRGFTLLRMLGFWRFEVYGFDSCLEEKFVLVRDKELCKHGTLGTVLEYPTMKLAQEAADELKNDYAQDGWEPRMAFEHHAYGQEENNSEQIIKVTCGSKIFYCHPWMASQAEEFMDQVKMMGDEVEMIVHGDGLISHILKTGAELVEKETFTLS